MKNKGLLKILVGFCFISTFVLAPFTLGGCNDTAEYRIGLTQFATHPAADAGRQGFKDALTAAGFEEGKDIKYDYQNPEGDATVEQSIAQKFVNDKVNIIFSFGTRVTQQCVKAAENTDIPVVFCGITDPVEAGLISSFENKPENVTGTSDMIEVDSTIELILQIVPGAKKIGTVYNAGEINSVVLANQFKAACSAQGINVSEKTVSTSAEVKTAAESLVGQVDAIWVGTDNTVISGLEALIKVCEDNKIPLFPSDDPSIERGGVACLGFDYYDIGYQAGEMAVKILKGTRASDIPAELGKKFSYTINTTAAERFDVTIPQAILDKALTNYGD
ncbi:MAG: ABC transporter substrate-binding protein [Dehalococcoidales bacterium]|nr:ABC transporter substrate-binding protein [Dehalococcoidales bacterium]